MCRINVTLYTCGHRIKRTQSSCRGQRKQAPDSSLPACRKHPSLETSASHKCGPCSRKDAEEKVYRGLGMTRDQKMTESQQTELDERLAEVQRTIPTTNWRAPAPTVYGRRPSQSRSVTRRKVSLLRHEVKAEDIGGPEAWESNLASDNFVPVYETVSGGGWDLEWPSETKSLSEEIAEDAAERGLEVENDQDEEDQSEEDQSEEDQAEEDQDESEEDGSDDDLLLLAQQTPLPLDPEVDEYDDRYTECEQSLPTTAIATLMPTQQEIALANGTNITLEGTLDTAPSESDTQHLPVPESDSQTAESPVEGSNTLLSLTRVTTPYGRSWQLAGDSKVRYRYRQHKQHELDSPEGKYVVGCWELVSVALI